MISSIKHYETVTTTIILHTLKWTSYSVIFFASNLYFTQSKIKCVNAFNVSYWGHIARFFMIMNVHLVLSFNISISSTMEMSHKSTETSRYGLIIGDILFFRKVIS